ncbi:mannitol dehydrogenase [Xylocopilactobacillus apicola]|uniref:Mannitol-1-phosphate 5-dehydrogenase n=1 Tax=Xylocopilactobacillus apicola TaxID=2932184 RepID=A0AAU9DU09_9LACO|nr:mannitol dehydrogenase [Xylocopilactobacillus apicola]BDR59674.1 mannitol-1-phosphate 5-dehydrogenase [Xylocopilactobacillus apicola]
MKNVIIVGAGRLGKGFMGETFYNAGWNITFLDQDPQVIDELNRNHSYNVTVHTTDRVFTNEVKNYQALLINEHAKVLDYFLQADLLMLPLYPQDFLSAARDLAFYFDQQFEVDPSAKKTLICLTNKNHIIPKITAAFRASLKDEQVKKWFDQNVVIRDSIVRRSTDATSNYSTDLVTTAVASLIIQGPVFSDFSDVKWLDVRDNVEMLKDIKVFTINGPHATTAYYGYLLGYDDIAKAETDPKVAQLIKEVHDETIEAVLYEYPVTRDQIRELEYLPAAKDEMSDSIYRVGFDPIRKVGKNDRLMGVISLCEKYKLKYDGHVKAVACAFAYDEPKDVKAQQIQQDLKNLGVVSTIAKYIERPAEDPVVQQIAEYYHDLSKVN